MNSRRSSLTFFLRREGGRSVSRQSLSVAVALQPVWSGGAEAVILRRSLDPPPQMVTYRKTALTIGLLAVAPLALYASALSYAPVYLHHDEVFFAVEAHAIASTWRDV